MPPVAPVVYAPLANLAGDRLSVSVSRGGGFSIFRVTAANPRDRRLVYANVHRLQEILADMGVNPKDMLVEPFQEGATCAVSDRLVGVLDDALLHLNAYRGELWVLSQDILTELVAHHMLAGEFETGHKVFNARDYF